MANLTTDVLCTLCLKETTHTATIDANKEVVLTCNVCKHFLKFPAGSDIKSLVKTHNDHNIEHVKSNIVLNQAMNDLAENLKSDPGELVV